MRENGPKNAMELTADTLWLGLIDHVRTHASGIVRTWFDDLSLGAVDGGRLEIITESPEQVTYLRKHCVRQFKNAAQFATGRLVTVEFNLANGLPVPTAATEGNLELTHLHGSYTFDNLVVGPCNRFANAACRAVSDAPGVAYNPLFLHGDVGLGKTHMLQATCHALLDRAPASRVVFLSCEAFINRFIAAVENSTLTEFRDQYRQADMLIIDDVQFLIGREGTQEEFFHTFNALYQVNRQIILSSDVPPAQMKGIEDRLISRFNWGLVARLDPPCADTRNAIIRKKMRAKGIDLPADLTMLIANEVDSNARELEGVLNRIHGLAALEGRKPDVALVEAALGQTLPNTTPAPKIADIAECVSERFGVKLAELQGKRRSRSIALPRQICMYIARQMTSHSLEEIGTFFGGRDHTTVLHAHRLIRDRLDDDDELRTNVQVVERKLRQPRANVPVSASA